MHAIQLHMLNMYHVLHLTTKLQLTERLHFSAFIKFCIGFYGPFYWQRHRHTQSLYS